MLWNKSGLSGACQDCIGSRLRMPLQQIIYLWYINLTCLDSPTGRDWTLWSLIIVFMLRVSVGWGGRIWFYVPGLHKILV